MQRVSLSKILINQTSRKKRFHKNNVYQVRLPAAAGVGPSADSSESIEISNKEQHITATFLISRHLRKTKEWRLTFLYLLFWGGWILGSSRL